jgi:O-antigen/teichoic acid export membrane protein
MMSLRRLGRLSRHPSSLLLGSTLSSVALGMLSAALQARALGPLGRGELAVAMVPGTLIATLLSASLPDFSARKAARGERPRSVSLLTLFFAAAIALVSLVPYLAFVRFHTQQGSDARILLIIFAATVGPSIWGSCLQGLAIGRGYWRTVALLRVAPVAIATLTLLTLVIGGIHPNVLTVGLILISTTYAPPFVYLFLRGITPHRPVPRALMREAASFSARGWPAGAIALVNQRVDLLMMTFLSSGRDLGYYAVATTLAAVLNAVANAIAMPMRNRISQGHTEVVPAFSAGTTWLTTALAVAVIACLPLLVRVVLGQQFLGAMPVMIWLLLAQIPLASVVILTQALVGAGKPGAPLIGELVALGSTVVLILGSYGIGGIKAAAISTGIGNVLSLIVLVYRVRREISPFPTASLFFINPRKLLSAAHKEFRSE